MILNDIKEWRVFVKFLHMRKMMGIFLNLEKLVDYGDEIKSKYLLLGSRRSSLDVCYLHLLLSLTAKFVKYAKLNLTLRTSRS